MNIVPIKQMDLDNGLYNGVMLLAVDLTDVSVY